MKEQLEGMTKLGRGLHKRVVALFEARSSQPWVEPESTPGRAQNLWRSLSNGDGEMRWVEEELAEEQRGRIALVSRSDPQNRALLARLRQEEPIPASGSVSYEGLFTLVELPTQQPSHTGAEEAGRSVHGDWPYTDDDFAPYMGVNIYSGRGELLDVVAQHDLALFLFDGKEGWRPEDARWYSRWRAMTVPVLPVMIIDARREPTAEQRALRERLSYKLGIWPALVGASTVENNAPVEQAEVNDLLVLVERMIALRPRLSISLAQEVVCCRTQIAQRLVRSGALMSTMLGAEPIPLIDLPFHFAIQWKVALQLAAIYGRPRLDLRNREMWGVVGVNLLVRYAAQQAVKLIPLVGWTASAALSGASTWMLGRTLIRLYGLEGARGPQQLFESGEKADGSLDSTRRLYKVRAGAYAFVASWRRTSSTATDAAPEQNLSTGAPDAAAGHAQSPTGNTAEGASDVA